MISPRPFFRVYPNDNMTMTRKDHSFDFSFAGGSEASGDPNPRIHGKERAGRYTTRRTTFYLSRSLVLLFRTIVSIQLLIQLNL